MGLRQGIGLFLTQLRTYVWLLLLAGLGVLASFVPLYNVLDMDFAWVLALVAGPAAGHVALGGARQWPLPEQSTRASMSSTFRLYATAWVAAATLLVPPVVAVILLGLGEKACAPERGVLYLALGPIPTALLGASWGAFIGSTIRRRWLAGLLLVVLPLGSVALAAYRLASEPPVIQLGHWYGFFPGSVYDFAQPLLLRLVALRLVTALWIVLLLLARAMMGNRRYAAQAGVMVCFMAIIAFGFEAIGRLDVNRDREDIQRALAVHESTEHFALYIDSKIPEPARQALAQDHEYAFARLTHLLGFAPQRTLASYLYASPQRRRALIGAARTSIARPWSGEMHLVFSRRFPQPILSHELAHLFSAAIGDETTGLSGEDGILPSLGLIEGLAVAAAWDEEEYTPHAWSAALHALDLAPDLERAMSVHGFWSAQPSQVYLSCGSFTGWLWQERGIAPFRTAYPRADLAGAYGAPVAELVREWQGSLEAIAVDAPLKERARFLFTRPSIFQRCCARKVALLAEEAARALKRKRIDAAQALYREALALDPERVDLMIQSGRVALRQGDAGTARAQAEASKAHPAANEPLRAAAEELLGDASWISGDIEQARAHWMRAYATPSSPLQRRSARIKAQAARDSEPRLIEYLFGTDKQTARRLLDEAVAGTAAPRLGRYLRGLLRLHRFEWAGAAADLEAAGDLSATAPEVEAFRVLSLADALRHDGAPAGAEPLYRKLMVREWRDGARAMLSDRIARCRFAAGEKQPFRDLLHPLGQQEQLVEPLDISTFAPEETSGFKMDRPDEYFDKETLYDYMDGAAEVYLHYGFERLTVRHYRGEDESEITLEVFDMGSRENAAALFRHGEQSGSVVGWNKDSFLIAIQAHPESDASRSALRFLPMYIDARIGSRDRQLEGEIP